MNNNLAADGWEEEIDALEVEEFWDPIVAASKETEDAPLGN